jgi:DNA-binding NarL/FixJ family response regulator
MEALRVAIVDDSPQVQRSLSGLLDQVDGVCVVGCAVDLVSARALLARTCPDVVVLDVALRGGERGLDVLRLIQREHPRVQVVALSNFGWESMREGFLAAGAQAYFDKAMEFTRARDWVAGLARRRQGEALH